MNSGENIISYVRHYCLLSFKEKPLHNADTLVFSQLAYNKYRGFVSEKPEFSLTLRELMDKDALPSLYDTTRVPEENSQLLYACADSPRYENIKIGFYRSDLDDDEEKQFSAVSFQLSENLIYVAFRGTDASIVGWKEDLNMAFSAPIPSQLEGVEYLRELAAAFPEARFYLGGHSKGGNIAEYAATFVPDETQERIIAIYNHDGPGFRDDGIDLARYGKIRDKIYKFVPEASVFGLLLEQHADYRVVESKAFLYLQHDPFSWLIEKSDFIYADEVSDFARRANAVIKRWLEDTDEETRQVFIEALYDALSPAREEGAELRNYGILKNAPLVISGIRTENPEVRQKVADTMSALGGAVAHELRLSVSQKTQRLRELKERFFPNSGEEN